MYTYAEVITSYGVCRVDEDPLICYGRMRVFMHLIGVAHDTYPAPPERPPSPFNTVSPAGVNPIDAVPLLFAQHNGCATLPLHLHALSLPDDV